MSTPAGSDLPDSSGGAATGSATTAEAMRATPDRRGSGRQLLIPLWVAAISLAVIAATLIIGSISIGHALHNAETSVQQLQQQVTQLQKGLNGVLGG